MNKYYTYLCGYYGMQNSGDDALLLATAWGSSQFLKEDNFLVSTPKDLDFPGLSGVGKTLSETQNFRGENRLRHYINAYKSKRIIFGGGSVLHNSHDINQKRHLIKLTGNKKNALAIGVGIGPFRDGEAEKSCAKFLNECAFVGVRDKDSYEVAKGIAPSANIKLTFDLAPQLLLNNYYYSHNFKRKGICICLCPRESLEGDYSSENLRNKRIAQSIKKVWEETGEPITLLDFNGHTDLGDRGVHQEIINLLGESVSANHITYDPNPLAVLKRLGEFKLILGMRLHASILGFLAATPVISLNYHSKCVGWCDQIGLAQELQFDTANIDPELLGNTILEGLESGFIAPQLSQQQAIKNSLLNWSVSANEPFKADILCSYSSV